MITDHFSQTLQRDSTWDGLWEKHLLNYIYGVPRAGLFLYHLFGRVRSSLELGCGSGLDSVYLANQGIHATAGDFSPYVIQQAHINHPKSTCKFEIVDAFHTPYLDDSFDLVFHNGLIVYFDDAQIRDLLREQLRLTTQYLVILAHNAHNAKLTARFRQLSEQDDLYRIRFFFKEQIKALLIDCGAAPDRITFMKFGGPVDVLSHHRLARLSLRHSAHLFYQMQPWHTVERIVCIVRTRI